jgi:hypothetical protein
MLTKAVAVSAINVAWSNVSRPNVIRPNGMESKLALKNDLQVHQKQTNCEGQCIFLSVRAILGINA